MVVPTSELGIEDQLHILEGWNEVFHDQRLDILELETAETTAEGRYGDGVDAVGEWDIARHVGDQAIQAPLNEIELGGEAEMVLGRKVDNPAIFCLYSEVVQRANIQMPAETDFSIILIHFGVALFELQGQAAPHDPVAVHRIDNGINLAIENAVNYYFHFLLLWMLLFERASGFEPIVDYVQVAVLGSAVTGYPAVVEG